MSITVMKQALEALERCGSENYTIEREAITSLRAAIASYSQAIASAEHVEAQEKQRSANEHLEPVAWLCKRGDGHFDVLTDQTCKKCFPVYTSPPQRQPLTDEQIEAIANEYGAGGWICDFVRAIEAAHGIKGEA